MKISAIIPLIAGFISLGVAVNALIKGRIVVYANFSKKLVNAKRNERKFVYWLNVFLLLIIGIILISAGIYFQSK